MLSPGFDMGIVGESMNRAGSDSFRHFAKVVPVGHEGHGLREEPRIPNQRLDEHLPEVPLRSAVSQNTKVEDRPKKCSDLTWFTRAPAARLILLEEPAHPLVEVA